MRLNVQSLIDAVCTDFTLTNLVLGQKFRVHHTCKEKEEANPCSLLAGADLCDKCCFARLLRQILLPNLQKEKAEPKGPA